MKKPILFSLLIILLFSCDKKTNWPLSDEGSNMIIVDGTITNELKEQSIKLTFPVSQLNETPSPVSGAAVVVSDGDSTYSLQENPANSGIYQHKFIGKTGKKFTLLINYKNNVFSAKTTMLPEISNIPPLKDTLDNNNSLYHITYVANEYDAENFTGLVTKSYDEP